MKYNNLHKTKIHLTVLFSVSLFWIVFILGFLFFSFRFFQSYAIDKSLFISSINEHIEEISGRDDILWFFGLDIDSEKVEEFFERQKWLPPPSRFWVPQRPVSFFIVGTNGKVLEKSIKESLSYKDILAIDAQKIIYRSGTFMTKSNISYFLDDAIIYFYKKSSYPLDSYLFDIGVFTVFLLLFSVLLSFLSYKFVWKTLRPVEENIQDMKDFIHNAGHELKTPLSVLRGNLQILEIEEKLDKQLVKSGIGEVDKLAWLINSLVELSETGKNSQKEYLKISSEVEKVVQDFESYAREHEVTIENLVKGKQEVYANSSDIHLVISNILKNAIKYNKKDWKVTLSYSKNILSIKDTGIGIKEEHQEKIFERFFQWNSARSSEWYGIGLSLVKKICLSNKWEIEVISKLWEGTTFKIKF